MVWHFKYCCACTFKVKQSFVLGTARLSGYRCYNTLKRWQLLTQRYTDRTTALGSSTPPLWESQILHSVLIGIPDDGLRACVIYCHKDHLKNVYDAAHVWNHYLTKMKYTQQEGIEITTGPEWLNQRGCTKCSYIRMFRRKHPFYIKHN